VALTFGTAGVALAGSVSLSGTFAGDPTMKSIFITPPNCTSQGSANLRYDAYPMTVTVTGGYSFTVAASTAVGIAGLYVMNSGFNPAAAFANCIAATHIASQASPQTISNINLTAGTQYYLVIFDDFNLQTTVGYNASATGPGDILIGQSDPDLAITKTHSGNFTHGQNGTYTINVSNAGGQPFSGQVTVKDTLPGVMTPVSAGGTGWSCNWTSTTVTCTRSGALATGASYPSISVNVHVSQFGAGRWVNVAKVSGGNDSSNANNVATDPTVVN
jgi:uncharacterized repeat protein (TIGR01451 family)